MFRVLAIVILIAVTTTLAFDEQSKIDTPIAQPHGFAQFINTRIRQETPKSDVDEYFQESDAISTDKSPQVITRNIRQDSKGRFWLATWNGVVRYDGKSFTNITNKENLRRYRAFSILEDDKKNIWLGTTGAGVYRHDGKTYTNFTTKDGLVNDTILSMMQDSDNNIWFGSMGATKFDGQKFVSFDAKDGFTDRDVNSISETPDGSIWFGTRGTLFLYDGKTFVDFTQKHGLKIDKNSYIPTLVDRKGHLWFSGSNGIFHYDGKKVKHVFKSASFSLFEDSVGNIWFSGGKLKAENELKPGMSVLNRFDPKKGIDNIYESCTQFEIIGGTFELSEDKEGNLWFGTGRGVGRIKGNEVEYF